MHYLIYQLLLISIFLSPLFDIKLLYGQDEVLCGTMDVEDSESLILKLKAQMGVPTNESLKSIYIDIYLVRETDGSGGISQQGISNNLNALEQAFSGTNIQFSISDTFNINNTGMYSEQGNYGLINSSYPTNRYTKKNKVFFVDKVWYLKGNNYEWAWGITSSNRKLIVIDKDISGGLLARTFAHEMGNVFGLLHTFIDNEEMERENIARVNTGNCNANCDWAADGFSDTPADPYKGWDKYNPYTEDNCGNTNYEPDKTNIMSYWVNNEHTFSEQQISRMHYELEHYQAALVSDLHYQFSNIDESQNNIGSVIKLEDNSYLYSGGFLPVVDAITYNISVPFNQINSLTHKNWDFIKEQFRYEEPFIADEGHDTKKRDAVFSPTFLANLNTNVDGIEFAQGFEFADPWKEQSLNQFNSSYGSEQVFLDEEPDPLNPQKPYYQI